MTAAAADSYEEYPHFFRVQLDLFDGPIDLLLHLVKQNELEIEKVSLAEVTQQYLDCLEIMRRFDLEVAGEYLVIAATLLSVKSSLLLQEPIELIEDEEGNLVDPHEELLRRLREAEVYKKGAVELGSRGQLGVDVFSAPSLLSEIESGPVTYQDHDPLLLGKAFRKLLEELPEPSKYTVTLEAVSVLEKMMEVLDNLRQAAGPVIFSKLITDRTSRASVVATFVALLELCKRQTIRVFQDETFKDIAVALAAEGADGVKLDTEFDEMGEQKSEESPQAIVSNGS